MISARPSSKPITECTLVVSIASSKVIVGRIEGKPLREHRLARSGRPDHQDVVTAGRRDLERALGLLLSFDLAEIDVVNVGVAERSGEIDRNRLERTQALEEFESLAQTLDSEHRGALADDGSLGGILAREHHALEL